MFDRYFDRMNKMITPVNYSTTSILHKANNKDSEYHMLDTTPNIIFEAKGKISEDVLKQIQQHFLNEKKENMFLRQENLEQQRCIDQLKLANSELLFQIERYKTQQVKDREYLIKLEQILAMNKFKLNKSKREKYFPRGGGSCLCSGVVSHISSSSCNNNQNCNMDNTKLKLDHDKMLKFKNEIYRLSHDYDAINTSIFSLIDEIRNLFDELNRNCLISKERDCFDGVDKAKEEHCFNKVKEDIEQIFNLMSKSFNTKQDEYKYLLNEKEIAIIELTEAKTLLLKEKDNLIEDNLRKESLIDDLKNEIFLMKDRKERLYNNKNNTDTSSPIKKTNKKKAKCSASSFCYYKTPKFDKQMGHIRYSVEGGLNPHE